MNPLVRPFAALRPRPDTAAAVIAPPYDVVDAAEARALVAGRPHSFLHVSRPEIDFEPGASPFEERVYARGADNLAALVRNRVLEREAQACFYAYRMTSGAHVQTGIAGVASVRAYEENRVRKHELTRPDKETDRVRNMEALNAQTGPVLCAFRSTAAIDEVLREATRAAPLLEAEGPHAVVHAVWRIAEQESIVALSRELCSLTALYIADGHHRSAAAARVAAARRAKSQAADEAASYEYFLCVAFPSAALEILDYNRVVADLNGMSAAQLLERLARTFQVTRAQGVVRPEVPRTFGLYVGGNWYRLRARTKAPKGDPVARLDVSLLHGEIIEPMLGIRDPRTDRRIDFVGGIRGLEALAARVDSGKAAAAFALYPPSMDELIAVADAGLLMPPKSTWFEPKLADGLLT
ncbi:MAG TPA: DUF1015 family protein, partial [Gammaproteobacteria bacterium]